MGSSLRKHDRINSNTSAQAIGIATLRARSLLAREAFLTVHARKFSSGTPPHSLLLPYNEREVAFSNIPFFSISPSKLLYERFRCLSSVNSPRNSVILPKKLFHERSMLSKPLKFFKV